MIEELRLRAIGVIEDALLELAPGFTVLTGETGAGKTIVVTGLGLLLGKRADASQIRTGADRAIVEGRLTVAADSEVAARIVLAGGEVEDGSVILVRTVSDSGRSKAHVGGAAAPVSVLSELASDLVAVHGQADQQRLQQPARQRIILDAYARNEGLLLQYQKLHRELIHAQDRITRLREQRRDRAQEIDRLEFGLREVAEAQPLPQEDETLRLEESRLSHAQELQQAAASARMLLVDDHDDGAVLAFGRARRHLDAVRDHDSRLAELADRVAEVGYLATDVAAELASYLQDLDGDPGRLEVVSDRLAQLRRLIRKYGDSLDDVMLWSDSAEKQLEQLNSADDDEKTLTSSITRLRDELSSSALALSAQRAAAGQRLAAAVSAELADLAMADASFRVSVEQKTIGQSGHGLELPDGRQVSFGTDGIDDVQFLLRAHEGAPELPLARGASGGELSRVMLALEIALAEVNSVPTFVFDEVDAGIGGKAAVEVGRRLAVLARSAQVIVVTHLPQVAAFADRHLVVTKSQEGVRSSDVTALSEAERARELARMLAGLEDSALGQAHAEELLAMAATEKPPRPPRTTRSPTLSEEAPHSSTPATG